MTKPQGAPLELKADQPGTLILRDVTDLNQGQQHTLSRWLENPAHRTQIVSTASQPVYPLVERGQFDAALYYRLNVMLFRL